MRSYELVLVLKPSLSAAQRKKLLDTVVGWLTSLKIIKSEEIGERPLSYRIKKENKGFFVKMDLEGEVVASDLEKRIINTEEMLRHLLIRRK